MPQEERNNKMLLPLEPMIGSLGISPESVHKGHVEILTVTPSRKKMMPTAVQHHHHRHKLDFQTRTCTPRNQEAIHGRVTILRTMIAWWRRPGGISGRVLVFMIYIYRALIDSTVGVAVCFTSLTFWYPVAVSDPGYFSCVREVQIYYPPPENAFR